MTHRMFVVRFVTDFGFYRRGEEAAFPEEQAMGYQQKGFATILGLADEVAGPKRVMKDATGETLPPAATLKPALQTRPSPTP